MRKKEEAAICVKDYGSNMNEKPNENTETKINFKGEIDMTNNSTKATEFQYKTSGLAKLSHTTTNFFCDECCLPLRLYGENHIKSYTGGQSNILRALCDSHAAEFGFSEVVR
jgi:hypothetical protein